MLFPLEETRWRLRMRDGTDPTPMIGYRVDTSKNGESDIKEKGEKKIFFKLEMLTYKRH